ncbi:MAG: hypothetical protein JO157_14090, partial [Acetobacteraceae bacterium]|nr:hypothetical protein [Acetobacteraceae bacterium]
MLVIAGLGIFARVRLASQTTVEPRAAGTLTDTRLIDRSTFKLAPRADQRLEWPARPAESAAPAVAPPPSPAVRLAIPPASEYPAPIDLGEAAPPRQVVTQAPENAAVIGQGQMTPTEAQRSDPASEMTTPATADRGAASTPRSAAPQASAPARSDPGARAGAAETATPSASPPELVSPAASAGTVELTAPAAATAEPGGEPEPAEEAKPESTPGVTPAVSDDS